MTGLAPDLDPLAKTRRVRERLGYCVAGAGMLAASLVVSPDWRGVLGGLLGLLMLAVAWADSRRFVVPDILSGSAFAVGIVHAFAASPDAGLEEALMALSRAAVAAGLLLAVRIVYRLVRGREGLGLGDVKLAAAAGVWMSLPMLPVALEIAAATGLAAYLWRQRRRNRVLRSTARIPFGAFFALAIWFTWALDTRLADLG